MRYEERACVRVCVCVWSAEKRCRKYACVRVTRKELKKKPNTETFEAIFLFLFCPEWLLLRGALSVLFLQLLWM